MYAVRSRSGRVLRRFATRGEAERFVRTQHSPVARGSATAKARWDALRAAYLTADEVASALRRTLELKYGSSNVRWASTGERNRLDKLTERRDKIGNKITELLVKISPRGEAWLSGVPAHWIYGKLTWEDAVRPVGEQLSVEPPLSWGATHAFR